MEYELQIRGGAQPAADLYQLSPSEVKQLLLDILQPSQNGRYRGPFATYRTLWMDRDVIASVYLQNKAPTENKTQPRAGSPS